MRPAVRRVIPPRLPTRQRGMILLFTLVALAVLLVGGVALLRSMDSALLQAGNLSFRRDLVNESERAMAQAITLLSTGALASEGSRQADAPARNYSASRLPSDAHGIPVALLSAAQWSETGMTAADLTDSATGITLRVVIDRQCAAAGDFVDTECVTVSSSTDTSADDRHRRVNAEERPVYRISVRADGPRNTQAFFQTTVVR